MPPNTHEALALCKTCTVADLCKMIVQPATSHYDGVCAGEVWQHGHPITRRPVTFYVPPIADPEFIDELTSQFSLCEKCGALLAGGPCSTCSSPTNERIAP